MRVVVVGLFAVVVAGSTEAAETHQGQCKMDICSWFRIDAKDTVQTTETGTLFKVTMNFGTSNHKGGNYKTKRPIKWEGIRHQYVLCSKTNPAVIYKHPDQSGWLANTLSPGHSDGVYGYNLSEYATYFVVCHSIADVDAADPRLADRFGYGPQLVDEVKQFDIANPVDILKGRGR